MDINNAMSFIGKIIFNKYKILRIIGMGSFGSVFSGENIHDKSLVAVKVEPRSAEFCHLLQYETYVLANLQGFGIPKLVSYGRSGNYNVLVNELLGKSLMAILKETCKLFTLKDICMIGIQMLDRLEFIHSKYFIHRDIKPDNFLIGREDPSIIYLIDFGLSKKYRSSLSKKHEQFALTNKLTGTLNFASVNANRGLVQSRRDDLESTGYVLLFMLKGRLPWENLEKRKDMPTSKYIGCVFKIKKKMEPEVLCKNLPQELADYFRYCKSLQFEQKPDYEYLRGLFKIILQKNNFPLDNKFTWLNIYREKSVSCGKDKARESFRKRKESAQTRLFNMIKNNLQNKQKKNLNNTSTEKENLCKIEKNVENNKENFVKDGDLTSNNKDDNKKIENEKEKKNEKIK